MVAQAIRQFKRPSGAMQASDGRLYCPSCGRTLVSDYTALRRAAPDRAYEIAKQGCDYCDHADESLPSQVFNAIQSVEVAMPQRKRRWALALVICTGLGAIVFMVVTALV